MLKKFINSKNNKGDGKMNSKNSILRMTMAVAGAFLIGLQQGAEVDIFAYFIARRFDLARYGTIYGTLIGLSWIGTATGVLGVGHIHDQTGSYDLAQLIGAVALAIGTVLLALIHLPSRATPLTR